MKKNWMSLVSAAALAASMLAAAPAGVYAAEAETETTAESNGLLQKILDRGTIIVGTEGTYHPNSYHDEDGSLVGFDVEVAAAVAEELGVEIEYFEASWDSLLASLESGRIDTVINEMTVTDERKEKYDFSDPYTFIHGAILVRSDNEDIHGLEDLDGKNAANELNSTWGRLAEEYGAVPLGVTSMNESIQLLLQGRADLTLNAETTFYAYMQANPDAEVKIAATTDDVSTTAIPVPKGNEDLVEAYNKALDNLHANGKLAEISEKYFGSDITEEPSEGLLDTILERGTIIVGTEGTYNPNSYHDEDGNLVGFDVEVAEAVADKLGVEIEFFEASWDSLLASLESGRVDTVINEMTVTDARKEKYDFSNPYTYIHGAILVRSDNEDIHGLEDLDGKKAANEMNSTWGRLAEEYGATPLGVTSMNESIQLLLQGRADLTLNAETTFYAYMQANPDAEVKVAATTDDVSTTAIPVQKNNKDLVRALNKALDELREDGTLAEISIKYFGSDVTSE